MNTIERREVEDHYRDVEFPTRFLNARDFTLRATLAALVFVALPLWGQEVPTTVMAGTKLRVQFSNEVGTAISRVNDGVEVHLLKPVDVAGREGVPVGTILSGRVTAVRKGDTRRKVTPVLRLAFDHVRLPDGRAFPVKASLANLGMMVNVDSEGAAKPAGHTKSRDVAAAAGTAGIGAGIGGIAGGGSGAAKGAAIGAGVGVLGDLITRNDAYWDFTLKHGRKAWLRLDQDLALAPAAPAPASSAPESRKP